MGARNPNKTRGPTCIFGHLRHIFVPHLSHIPQHCEDDKSWNEARHAIHHTGHQGVSGAENPRGLRHFQVRNLRSICLQLWQGWVGWAHRDFKPVRVSPPLLPGPSLSDGLHYLEAQAAVITTHGMGRTAVRDGFKRWFCCKPAQHRPLDFKQGLFWSRAWVAAGARRRPWPYICEDLRFRLLTLCVNEVIRVPQRYPDTFKRGLHHTTLGWCPNARPHCLGCM